MREKNILDLIDLSADGKESSIATRGGTREKVLAFGSIKLSTAIYSCNSLKTICPNNRSVSRM